MFQVDTFFEVSLRVTGGRYGKGENTIRIYKKLTI